MPRNQPLGSGFRNVFKQKDDVLAMAQSTPGKFKRLSLNSIVLLFQFIEQHLEVNQNTPKNLCVLCAFARTNFFHLDQKSKVMPG
jgi:hypothetical protein